MMTPLDQVVRALGTLDPQVTVRVNVTQKLSLMTPQEQLAEVPALLLALEHSSTAEEAAWAWWQLINTDMDSQMRRVAVKLVAQRMKTRGDIDTLRGDWAHGNRDLIREAWLKVPSASLAGAHSLYVAAARVVDAGALPTSPVHGGAPAPKTLAIGYVELGLMVLERLQPLMNDEVRKTYGLALPALRHIVTHGEPRELPMMKTPKTPIEKTLSSVMVEAKLVTHSPDKVGGAMRPAMKNAATVLQGDVDAQRSLLEAIDAELVRLDATAALHRLELTTSAPVVACQWRGVDGGKVKLWLMVLGNERFALLSKPKHRWEVNEGDRDAVLASVPDAFFPSAIAAVHERHR